LNYSLINTIREEKNITLENLANKIGKTRGGLSTAIKKETLAIKDLEAISQVLGVSPCVFFGGESEYLSKQSNTEECKNCSEKDELLEIYKERTQELKERVEEQKIFNRTYQDTITMYQKRLEEYENPSEGLSKASS